MAWPNGTRLKSFANGGSFLPLDANNIEDRMLQIAGYRGVSNIATEESRTNTAYGTLATPDQVAGMVVPTDGLLWIALNALVKESVVNAARVAIFVGASQLRAGPHYNFADVVDETQVTAHNGGGTAADLYRRLTTSASDTGAGSGSLGVTSRAGLSVASGLHAGDSAFTTPFLMIPYAVEVPAGTYTVSVQYKSTSGSVTAKNRKLRVWVEAFA